MPSRRPFRTRRLIAAGVGGVLVGVAMAVAVVLLADDGNLEVRLGDDEFRAGKAEALAPAIERDGPVLFPDLVGGARSLYVHHTGGRPAFGWLAVDAVAPGGQPHCVLEWDPHGEVFADPCGDARYPPDSDELVTYPTRYDDGFVYVDLRGAR